VSPVELPSFPSGYTWHCAAFGESEKVPMRHAMHSELSAENDSPGLISVFSARY
jgi:hypothetical protein